MAIAALTDRAQAGRLPAERLRTYAGREDVVVLGLPRGAIATGGTRVLNEQLVNSLDMPREWVEAIDAKEMRELERRLLGGAVVLDRRITPARGQEKLASAAYPTSDRVGRAAPRVGIRDEALTR